MPVPVLWFYGLSGSGKTTVIDYAQQVLQKWNIRFIVLDADALRAAYWPEIGLSRDARLENTRRIATLAKTYAELGVVVLVAACAPFQAQREEALTILPDIKFVYIDTSLDVCQARKPHTYTDASKSVTLIDALPFPWSTIPGSLYTELVFAAAYSILEECCTSLKTT
jgi:adenylylsulfate kinase